MCESGSVETPGRILSVYGAGEAPRFLAAAAAAATLGSASLASNKTNDWELRQTDIGKYKHKEEERKETSKKERERRARDRKKVGI